MQINITQEIQRLDNMERFILNRNLKTVISRSLAVIRPKPRISRIEWAEQNIILPDSFPKPGPFRIKNSPHLRAIFEALDDEFCREIDIMGSSQFGKTLLMIIDWAYNVVLDPCNMIMGQPTGPDMKSFATQKLWPVIEASPVLRKLIYKRKRGASNSDSSSTFLIYYPGGITEIISLSSKGRTRQRTAKRVYSDDEDAIEMDKQTEGDPASNLDKRTTVHKYDYFRMHISVPGKDGESRIQKRYDQSSQGEFHIVCPDCGTEQSFQDENLDWEKEKDIFGQQVTKNHPETAFVKCKNIKCSKIFTEKDRMEVLQNIFCIHKHPEIRQRRGFHMGQLMSSLSSFAECANDKIKAMTAEENGDESQMETYVNQNLGLPYKKVKTKEVDAKLLMDIREDYITEHKKRIPNEVLLITFWADLQAGSANKPARIEGEFWGWGKGEECWILDKFIIPGNPVLDSTWNLVNKYITKKSFVRADGLKMSYIRGGFDSGWEPNSVYDYVAKRYRKQGLLATKGSNKYGAPLIPKKLTLVNKNKSVLMNIGTQAAKTIIYRRLDAMCRKGDDGNYKLRPGKKYIHLTRIFCDAEYYDQLTAEHFVRKFLNGQQYLVCEPKKRGIANETLDIIVGNYCLMKSLNPNWEKMEDSLKKKMNEQKSDLPAGKAGVRSQETEVEEPESRKKIPENTVKGEMITTPTGRRKRKIKSNNFVQNW